MNLRLIVLDPINQAFHNVCQVLTPPPGTKQLIGLGLKYCLKETPSSKVIQEGNTRLTRNVRRREFFHVQLQTEEPAIFDPKHKKQMGTMMRKRRNRKILISF
jgi:hypothetical protein